MVLKQTPSKFICPFSGKFIRNPVALQVEEGEDKRIIFLDIESVPEALDRWANKISHTLVKVPKDWNDERNEVSSKLVTNISLHFLLQIEEVRYINGELSVKRMRDFCFEQAPEHAYEAFAKIFPEISQKDFLFEKPKGDSFFTRLHASKVNPIFVGKWIDYYIEVFGSLKDLTDQCGTYGNNTPLIWLACNTDLVKSEKFVELAETLIAAGVDPLHKSNNGNNFLHWLSESNKTIHSEVKTWAASINFQKNGALVAANKLGNLPSVAEMLEFRTASMVLKKEKTDFEAKDVEAKELAKKNANSPTSATPTVDSTSRPMSALFTEFFVEKLEENNIFFNVTLLPSMARDERVHDLLALSGDIKLNFTLTPSMAKEKRVQDLLALICELKVISEFKITKP